MDSQKEKVGVCRICERPLTRPDFDPCIHVKEKLDAVCNICVRESIVIKNEKRDVFIQKGKYFIGRKEYKRGITSLFRALEIDPLNLEANLLLGDGLLESGNYSDAVETFLKIGKYYPDDTKSLMLLARAYRRDYQPHLAFYAYKKVLELNPNHIGAHIQMGIICLQSGNADYAMNEFNAVLKINPQVPDAFYYLGLIHQKKEQFDTSEMMLRKAVALRADYREAYKSLAEVLKKQGKKEEADEILNKHCPFDSESIFGGGNVFGVGRAEGTTFSNIFKGKA